MLKLQYFGHLMQRANSLEKTLMLGKIEGKRRSRENRGTWQVAVHGVTKSDTGLSDCTTTKTGAKQCFLKGKATFSQALHPFNAKKPSWPTLIAQSYTVNTGAPSRHVTTEYLKCGWYKLRKTSTSPSLTMLKPLSMWITTNRRKFWKRWDYQTTWPASWETYMQVRKQQLELDMEQQTGSK